jgi:hypothetical protein
MLYKLIRSGRPTVRANHFGHRDPLSTADCEPIKTTRKLARQVQFAVVSVEFHYRPQSESVRHQRTLPRRLPHVIRP